MLLPVCPFVSVPVGLDVTFDKGHRQGIASRSRKTRGIHACVNGETLALSTTIDGN